MLVCVCVQLSVCEHTRANKKRKMVGSDSRSPVCPAAPGPRLFSAPPFCFVWCVSAMISVLPEAPVLLGISPLRDVHSHFTPSLRLLDTEEQRSLLKYRGFTALLPFGCWQVPGSLDHVVVSFYFCLSGKLKGQHLMT